MRRVFPSGLFFLLLFLLSPAVVFAGADAPTEIYVGREEYRNLPWPIAKRVSLLSASLVDDSPETWGRCAGSGFLPSSLTYPIEGGLATSVWSGVVGCLTYADRNSLYADVSLFSLDPLTACDGEYGVASCSYVLGLELGPNYSPYRKSWGYISAQGFLAGDDPPSAYTQRIAVYQEGVAADFSVRSESVRMYQNGVRVLPDSATGRYLFDSSVRYVQIIATYDIFSPLALTEYPQIGAFAGATFLAGLPLSFPSGTTKGSGEVSFLVPTANLVNADTLRISIDPFRETLDPNFSNNDAVVNLKESAGVFELEVRIDGVSVGQAGVVALAPSVYQGTCSPNSVPTRPTLKPLQVFCRNKTKGTYVDGCGYKVTLARGANNGGHAHEGSPRPLGGFVPAYDGSVVPIAATGTSLVYEASDISQEVILSFSGTDPGKKSIAPLDIVARIRDPDSVGWVTLGDIEGFSIATESHPEMGVYGAKQLHDAIAGMVKEFRQTHPNKQIRSQAGSLYWGGLFDILKYKNQNTEWKNPHCGHRNGLVLDISMSGFSSVEKKDLRKAAEKNGFQFKVYSESPDDDEADHWHASQEE